MFAIIKMLSINHTRLPIRIAVLMNVSSIEPGMYIALFVLFTNVTPIMYNHFY